MRCLPIHVASLLFCSAAAAFAQTTARVSVSSAGVQSDGNSTLPSLSPDGRFVVFESTATNLVAGDTNGFKDVFVRDMRTSQTTRASVDSAGAQANQVSEYASVSSSGRYVAFVSLASNLVAGDTNGAADLFLRDRLLGTTRLVSHSPSGAPSSGGNEFFLSSFSADERFLVFQSSATNLVAGDTNFWQDIFLYTLQTDSLGRISVGPGGVEGDGSAADPRISGDGRLICYTSHAENMVPGDGNLRADVFVYDQFTALTTRVNLGPGGVEANNDSAFAQISTDGSCVAYSSLATNLVTPDTNGFTMDVFVTDLASGQTTRVSDSTAGAQADSNCREPAISSDGRFVAFTSQASNLSPQDGNPLLIDVFEHDRLANTTDIVSIVPAGTIVFLGAETGIAPYLSDDGSTIAFTHYADNLVAGDTNQRADVFLYRKAHFTPPEGCFGDGSWGACPCGNSGSPLFGCANSVLPSGARLETSGDARLSLDTLSLSASGVGTSGFVFFVQSTALGTGAAYGDGLLCLSGELARLFVVPVVAAGASAPPAGGPSISARAAALGQPIAFGSTRHYQAIYRDLQPAFCAPPAGGAWNTTNSLSFQWDP